MDKINRIISKAYEKFCNHKRKLPSSFEGKPIKKADMHVHTSFSKETIPGGRNRHYGYEKITNFLLSLLVLYRKLSMGRKFYKSPYELKLSKNYDLYFHLPYSPKEVFDNAVNAGMDFVPITDHNTIEGALWLIKKYPSLAKRIIVGEEVSSVINKKYFIDVGVYDINRKAHEEIQARRGDARKLVIYLRKNGILFSINHMTAYLWGHIKPISSEEISNCIKLFDIFEVRNGMLAGINNKITEVLAAVYKKGMVAGTDSHLLRTGKTYTAAYANSKEEFLEQIRQKKSYACGRHGSPYIMKKEIIDKFSNYKNIFLDGKKLFPGQSRFHDFVFDKIGKRVAGKIEGFVGTGMEIENAKSVLEYLKKNLQLF